LEIFVNITFPISHAELICRSLQLLSIILVRGDHCVGECNFSLLCILLIKIFRKFSKIKKEKTAWHTIQRDIAIGSPCGYIESYIYVICFFIWLL